MRSTPSWDQYQPFVEVDLHPLTDLTITPGFKYIWWNQTSPRRWSKRPSRSFPSPAQFTTTQDLPLRRRQLQDPAQLERLFPVCQGHLHPRHQRLRAEDRHQLSAFPKAETTTNYQFGTVYYADNFTFDADVYYIGVNNNIV